MFPLILEGEEGGEIERRRETKIGCLPTVPWLGIEPVAPFGVQDAGPTNWATQQGQNTFLKETLKEQKKPLEI